MRSKRAAVVPVSFGEAFPKRRFCSESRSFCAFSARQSGHFPIWHGFACWDLAQFVIRSSILLYERDHARLSRSCICRRRTCHFRRIRVNVSETVGESAFHVLSPFPGDIESAVFAGVNRWGCCDQGDKRGLSAPEVGEIRSGGLRRGMMALYSARYGGRPSHSTCGVYQYA